MNKKTIIITGSTRGIGLGLAREFLTLGHNVVINGRSKVKVDELVLELHKINPGILGVAGSVVEEETHQRLISKAIKEFGRVDIWINNAGIPQPHKRIVDLETSHFNQLIEINIVGSIIGSKVAANAMMKQGSGRIFNLEGFGSDGRLMDKLTLYGTSKRAINYFTKSIANELKDSPVQIGIIQPGMVRTEFLNINMDASSEAEMKQFEKVKKFLAEDVDIVTKAIAPRILSCRKNYERVEFLSKFQMMGKVFRMLMAR